MDSLLLLVFFLMLTTAHAAKQEAISAQTYWRTVLPQTPIPDSIQELLQPEKEMDSFGMERSPTLFVSYGMERSPTLFVSYGMKRSPTLFVNYKGAATENQIQNDPNAPLFFLKDSLNPGKKMSLDLTKIISSPPFLTNEKAKVVPFSSSKLGEILNLFSIKQGSPEANAVAKTLAECEELPLDNERKRCVTSMEAMVEFVEAELGDRDVRVLETTVRGGGKLAQREEFLVGLEGARQVRAEAMVSCHPEPYPRAVYYCHRTTNIEVYKMHLLGVDDVVVDAIATCHTNTKSWNPGYMGFKMLNVKPGTEPICHFLPQGHLIFALLPKKATIAI